MNFILRCALVLAIVIAWTYDPEAPDEVESAQATQDWINDTAAQLVAARRGE